MSDIDHSTAIKRLARDLRFLVYVQIAAFCIFALGILLLTSIRPIPENYGNLGRVFGEWLFIVGMILFVIVAFWSSAKLIGNTFLPIGIRRYALGVWLLLPLVGLGVCLLNGEAPVLEMICICIFPLYCIVPQFFIARWLSKKAKDGVTQLVAGAPKHLLLLSSKCWLTILAIPTLVVLILFGWTVLISFIPKPVLVISEETTYVTGPLTTEGYIDFFKAWEQRSYPPEFATDDNGYRVFVRLFGDAGYDGKPEDHEFYRLQKYEKLGLDPNVPPTLVLPLHPNKAIEEFYKAQGKEYLEREHNQWDRPWTLEDYPMLADWVNEIDIPLDAIAETVRKPIFFFPLLQCPESAQSGKPQHMLELRLPGVQASREIAQIFQARATFRIGQGNIDGAIDDQLTMLHWGRQVATTGSIIVQHLVGVSMEAMARAIPVGANPERPLTEQQIRRILEGLNALPPRTPFTDVFEIERFITLSSIQYIDMTENKHLFRKRAYDINIVYRRLNELFDAMQEPPPQTKYHAILEEAETNCEKQATITIWDKFVLWMTPGHTVVETAIADMFIALVAPAISAGAEAVHRAECSENMQRLALAILLYQHEHGTMPDENWTTQIEKYLGENPEQYFSCPSNLPPVGASAEGKTPYALVQYGDKLPTNPHVLLLIELAEAVPLGEAVISADEVLARQRTGSVHSGGTVVAHRSGAVRFLPSNTEEAELRRMLGRE